MTLRWLSVLLSTGEVIADLASVDFPQSPMRKTIGQYDTVQASMYLDGAPRNWLRATRPGAAGLVCYDDSDTDMTPQWGGYITTRARARKTGMVDLSLSTWEGYFDRRIVGDCSFAQVGQNEIARQLVFRYAGRSSRYPGCPFTFTNEDGDSVPGKLRDRQYLDADNTTLYSRLQQLSGVDGGVEWTVDLRWDGTNTKILPNFRYGTRIGRSPAVGRRPEAVFHSGNIVDAEYVESYADGDGANVVVAYSSGQPSSDGSTTAPTSGPVFAPYNLRPAFESRYQPSSSITDNNLLRDYARRAAAVLGEGQNALTLTAAITRATRYGGSWWLGDDIEAQLDQSLQFPGGVDLVARSIGYEVDPRANLISPILATNDVPTDDSSSM